MLTCVALYSAGAYASRGWYVSVGGLSAKQSHDVSNYSYSRDAIISRTEGVVAIPSTSGNTYWFKQDSSDNNNTNTYSSFSSLKSTVDGKYVVNTVTITLNNEVSAGTSPPSFVSGSGSANGTIGDNTSPTNSTGGNITNGLLTYTYGGASQVIGSIDRLSSSASLYQVTLTPINISSQAYRSAILLELDSKPGIKTERQMQDFVSLFNDQSSRTVEFSVGYKFRPLRSPFFIAPQADFTYFKASGGTKSAYMNPATNVISTERKIPNDALVTYGSFDLSYTASLIFKFGFEQRFWISGVKIPFSIYGLLGGSSSFRNINSIRDNAFGFKYGFGGEIFASERLAFFGEFYQIQYIAQDYIFDHTSNYAGSAINSNNGMSVSISNGGTGANAKTININYPSDSQMVSAQVRTTEKYTLQSRVSAIKFGLTYYFQ